MPAQQICLLPDGRQLSFVEFGKPDGDPVFYFHGVPASCYEVLLVNDDEIKKFGLRIIAPNRPGLANPLSKVGACLMIGPKMCWRWPTI